MRDSTPTNGYDKEAVVCEEGFRRWIKDQPKFEEESIRRILLLVYSRGFYDGSDYGKKETK